MTATSTYTVIFNADVILSAGRTYQEAVQELMDAVGDEFDESELERWVAPTRSEVLEGIYYAECTERMADELRNGRRVSSWTTLKDGTALDVR